MRLVDTENKLKNFVDDNGEILIENVKATKFFDEGDFYVFAFGPHYTFYNKRLEPVFKETFKISAYKIGGNLLAYRPSCKPLQIADSEGNEVIAGKFEKFTFFDKFFLAKRGKYINIVSNEGELLEKIKGKFFTLDDICTKELVFELGDNDYAIFNSKTMKLEKRIHDEEASIFQGDLFWTENYYGFCHLTNNNVHIYKDEQFLGIIPLRYNEKYDYIEEIDTGFNLHTHDYVDKSYHHTNKFNDKLEQIGMHIEDLAAFEDKLMFGQTEKLENNINDFSLKTFRNALSSLFDEFVDIKIIDFNKQRHYFVKLSLDNDFFYVRVTSNDNYFENIIDLIKTTIENKMSYISNLSDNEVYNIPFFTEELDNKIIYEHEILICKSHLIFITQKTFAEHKSAKKAFFGILQNNTEFWRPLGD